MENITFKRKADSKYVSSGKAVGMGEAEWEQIRDIAEKAGLPMREVATMLVRFALYFHVLSPIPTNVHHLGCYKTKIWSPKCSATRCSELLPQHITLPLSCEE